MSSPSTTLVPCVRRQPVHSGKDLADRGDPEIGNVKRNLGPSLHQHPHGLNPIQAATGGPQRLGNRPGRGHVRPVQIEVVGDEELACSHRAGAGSGVQFRATQIGTPGRIPQHQLAQTFKLALTDLLQQRPVGPGSGRFVEVDGDVVAGSRFPGQPGERAWRIGPARCRDTGTKGITSVAPMRG